LFTFKTLTLTIALNQTQVNPEARSPPRTLNEAEDGAFSMDRVENLLRRVLLLLGLTPAEDE
jgi:hypothetical protein